MSDAADSTRVAERSALRTVAVWGVGVVAPDASAAGPGPVVAVGFNPREHLPEKKHAKLMSRAVQLGIAALKRAVDATPAFASVPPERRAMFAGAGVGGGGEPEELIPALQASRLDGKFDLGLFGERGIPLVPPLWLVRGLSNNVVGYGSAYFETRGQNNTRCDGRHAGLGAVIDAIHAIGEGRADVALAGGADSLCWVGPDAPVGVGEAGVFLVLGPGGPDQGVLSGASGWSGPTPYDMPAVEFGAVTGLIDLARRWAAGERGFAVEARDPAGGWARVAVR